MCGITGIYAFSPFAEDVDERVLVDMRDTLVHRGPDGDGLFVSEDRRIGLGHRRLSIVDLAGGAQPMYGRSGEALVFNGEIYNYPDLRRELEADGVAFQTRCDTEVILRLYERQGLDCVDRLEGMFAFAIWDPGRERLVLARDPVGEKPLYWTEAAGELIFASEIKALLRHPRVSARVNESALADYLANLVVTPPETLFQGIYKLAAGELGVCDGGGISIRRYSDLLAPRVWHSELEDPGQTIRTMLGRSVDRRLMSDVPVGVLLSGGIDSTTIVALLKERARGTATFSVGFSDVPGLDERDEARRVAAHFGTDHHEVAITEDDAIGFLEGLIHHQDEPLADPVCLPLYFVCELAARNGIKVVLAGEGADEMFWGYARYRELMNTWRWTEAALKLPAPARRLLPKMLPAAVSPRRHEYLGAIADGRVPAAHFPVGLARDDREHVLLEKFASQRADRWRRVPPQARERTQDAFAFDTQEYEFALRLPELLLMRIDRFSMANSVEARVPFLAPELVDFAYRLPVEHKLHNGKTKVALRAAISDIVPEWVLQRPKRGFGAPVSTWMSTGLGDVLRSLTTEDTIRAYFDADSIARILHAAESNGGTRHMSSAPRRVRSYYARWQNVRVGALWPILNFALWHRHWIESEPITEFVGRMRVPAA